MGALAQLFLEGYVRGGNTSVTKPPSEVTASPAGGFACFLFEGSLWKSPAAMRPGDPFAGEALCSG